MGPLIFIARTHQIKRKKSQLNLRLMQITNKREQLAEQISNAEQQKTAKSNMRNLMTSTCYKGMQNSLMMSMMTAQMNNNKDGMLSAYNQMNTLSAMSSMQSIFNQIESNNDSSQLEYLNAIDSQLEQEQTGIESQLKLLEAELQSVEKQMDQEIKNAAPKFGMSG